MQIVLDPNSIADASREVSIPLLNPKTRKFGYVPAIDQLLPGDLVLYSESDFVARLIDNWQRRAGFSNDDARWSHAAVYLDDGFVVEAIPKGGVVQRSIYEGIPSGLMRFRRLVGLSDIDRYRIALRALSRLGRSYSISRVPKLSLSLGRGLWNRVAAPDEKGIVICSQIYHDSIVEITRSYLDQCPVDAAVTPAHLSYSGSMIDLEIGWLRLR